MKKRKAFTFLALALSVVTLVACGSKSKSSDSKTYTVGVVSDSSRQIWKKVSEKVKDDGIDLKVKVFSDYNTPNIALTDGSIDLNAFQHVAFMENYNKERKGDLVSIGYTFVSPLGLYSKKIKDYKDLKDGDTIAIPNDVTNQGRALQLLNSINVIELKKDAPESPGLKDIEKYNVKVKIKDLDAAQTARALEDVDASVINTNYAVDSGLDPKSDAIYLDTNNLAKVGDIYKNVISVKEENKDNEDFKKIVKAFQSDDIIKISDDLSDGNDIPAWTK